jgi:hypothetical protein
LSSHRGDAPGLGRRGRLLRDAFALLVVVAIGATVAYGLASPDPEPADSTGDQAGPSAQPSAEPAPGETSSPAAQPTPSATASSAGHPRPPRVRHVVVVSLDGFGSNVVEAAGLDRLPTISRLVEEGAATFNARSEVEMTVTLPNHTGMLTGRPVDPAAGGHGVTVNGEGAGTVQGLAGGPVESVFDVVHAAGGSTALFATEEKFALFERSWPDSIDRFTAEQDQDAEVLGAALDDLTAEQRTFSFVHLGLVDEIGHRSGWLSADQLDAAATVDALLGDLVETVSADRRLARRLVLVVTADHGGVGKAHGDAGDPRDFTVPFLVWGAGVSPGADLYELNPGLTDPGDDQPAYDDAPPVRNGCVADVVTALLRLPQVDGSSLCPDGLVLGAGGTGAG